MRDLREKYSHCIEFNNFREAKFQHYASILPVKSSRISQ